jgi:hypothetical protein
LITFQNQNAINVLSDVVMALNNHDIYHQTIIVQTKKINIKPNNLSSLNPIKKV